MKRVVMHRYEQPYQPGAELLPVHGVGPWWAHVALSRSRSAAS